MPSNYHVSSLSPSCRTYDLDPFDPILFHAV
jgi:hypothetical protein